MDAIVVWFGVVFPSCGVLACLLIGRHFVVQARTAARNSRDKAEASRLAAQNADNAADDAHAIAAGLREHYDAFIANHPPSVDDRPTEVMERVAFPEQDAELESPPLARTPAQRFRAAGADSVGRHRMAPSPGPRALNGRPTNVIHALAAGGSGHDRENEEGS